MMLYCYWIGLVFVIPGLISVRSLWLDVFGRCLTARACAPSGLSQQAVSSEAASPYRGGFACPICGQETPHHHTAKVVDAYQNKRSRK